MISFDVKKDSRGSSCKLLTDGRVTLDNNMFMPVEWSIIKGFSGTLRGLHFQDKIKQNRIIYCISGELFCAVVDLNKDIGNKDLVNTYMLKYGDAIYVPHYCALGTYSLSDTIMCFATDEKTYPEYAEGILWSDEKLGINWPSAIKQKLIVSDRDSGFKPLFN